MLFKDLFVKQFFKEFNLFLYLLQALSNENQSDFNME